jgi:hypothetical protein
MEPSPIMNEAVATLTVDRWYKGSGSSQVRLSFSYDFSWGANGHYCISFRPGTYWIVFATGTDALKLVDDCDGALSVSRLIATDSCKDNDILSCMIADFAAGLDDEDLDGRIVSIQRVGNLQSRDALPILHSELQHSRGKEYEWAVYATLRSGDSVLPKTEALLQVSPPRTLPEDLMYREIASIRDESAVPDLLSILAHVPMAAFECIIALGAIGSPKAGSAIAPYLAHPDQGVRYQALDAMLKLTRSSACAISPDLDIDSEVARCLAWWQSTRSGSVSHP